MGGGEKFAPNNNSYKDIDNNSNKIQLPFPSNSFFISWEKWKQYKKEQYKFEYKSISEKSALTKLFNDSKQNELTAIKMIDNAIANTWKGIFPLKEEKPKTYSGGSGKMTMPDWG